MEEFDGLFRQGQISGQLRVDMPSRMARHLVIPALPDFLRSIPPLATDAEQHGQAGGSGARGFDCVVRVGALEPSSPGGQAPWSLSPDQLCQRRLPGSPRGALHPLGIWRATGWCTMVPGLVPGRAQRARL